MSSNHFFLSTSPPNPDKDLRKLTTHLSVGTSKILYLFDIEKFTTKIFIVCLVSVFIGIYNFFLLSSTGLYSGGINSIFQSVARCISYFLKKDKNEVAARIVHIFFFWGMSIIMNLPLAIMGFRKIGSKFTILTITTITVSSLTSMFLASLPLSLGLKNFHIFSDPRTFNCKLLDEGIQVLQWNYVTIISPNSGGSGNAISMNDSSRIVILFLYGVAYGVMNTISSMFIYSLGGSTGGVDWIIHYFMKKYKRRFTRVYLYLSLVIIFISYLIGTYIPYADYMFSNSGNSSGSPGIQCSSAGFKVESSFYNNTTHSVISSMFGPMLFATLISVLVKRTLFRFFYTPFKIVNVRIYTNRAVDIRRKLIESNFPQSFTINLAIGGYKLRQQTALEVVCFHLDLKVLKEISKAIDPQCIVVATSVQSLVGRVVVPDNIE